MSKISSAAAVEATRSKILTKYGIVLNDDEIQEFNTRMRKAQAPAIPCVLIPLVVFIILVASGNLDFSNTDMIPVFVILFIVCVAGGAGASSQSQKIERAFIAEANARRGVAPGMQPGPMPGTYSAGTYPGMQPQYNPQPAPYQQQAPVQPIILKETTIVVKVRCQFCNSLVDQGAHECPNCGGKM
nr:hypothetical protein [Candidatus Sigynarchaeota archaeon]